MSDRGRIVSLTKLRLDYNAVHRGEHIVEVPEGLAPIQYMIALRAYFVALGELVNLSKIGSTEIYVKLEE